MHSHFPERAILRTTEGNVDPSFTLKNIQQHDGPSQDAWFFEIPPDLSVSLLESEGRIQLLSAGASNALLPGSGGLTGSLIVPTLANFQSATGFFGERATPSNSVTSSVFFNVDTLTVPEPGAAASSLAALAALALVRSRLSRN